MPAFRSFSGARTRIISKGKEVGWAVSASVAEQTNLTSVDVLDNAYSQELEVNSIVVTGDLSTVYIYGNDLVQSGQYPQGNPTDKKYLVVLEPEFDFQFVDGVTGNVLVHVHGAKFTSRSLTATREGVMMQNCSCRARYLETLAAPAIP